MRQDELPFSGTVNGQTTTDRKAWPALVKEQAPNVVEPFTRGGKAVRIQTAHIPPKPATKHRPISYSQLEQEWLGVDVTSDVLVGVWQVWSLHRENRYVWLVRDGEARAAHVDSLSVAQ